MLKNNKRSQLSLVLVRSFSVSSHSHHYQSTFEFFDITQKKKSASHNFSVIFRNSMETFSVPVLTVSYGQDGTISFAKTDCGGEQAAHTAESSDWAKE